MIKEKKCKSCKKLFKPYNSLSMVCSKECEYEYKTQLALKNLKQIKKEEKKIWNQRKVSLMSLSDWLKIAQTNFNHYIRLRDKGNNCISCNKKFFKDEIVHASHYKPAGSCYNVRFNEDNVHVSCVKCNTHLSGNPSEYRIRLINKIGVERVEYIESIANVTRKFTIDEVKEINEYYKKKIKELKNK